MIVAIAGLATGAGAALFVLAGALFIGGLVAMVALGVQMGDLAGKIADTESQIRTTNTAISELSTVTDSFVTLDQLYGDLNSFWGTLSDDAGEIATDDEATMEYIGAGTLAITDSIISAQQISADISDACQKYLDVLHRQGVIIPPTFMADAATPSNSTHTTPVALAMVNGSVASKKLASTQGNGVAYSDSLTSRINGTTPISITLLDNNVDLHVHFFDVATHATGLLSNGDFEGYKSTMKYATVVHQAAITRDTHTLASTGMWFDIPTLSKTSSIWPGFSADSIKSFNSISNLAPTVPNTPESLNSQLANVKPAVKEMLQKTIDFAAIAVEWATEYPTLSKAITPPVTALHDSALKACQAALASATSANNDFVDFNRASTSFTQEMEVRVNTNASQIDVERAKADSDMNHISVPWYIYLAGPASVLIYEENEKSNIRNRLNATLDAINNTINELRGFEDSGKVIDGGSATWQAMVQDVSGKLGSLVDVLVAIEGQIMENPEIYADFMHQEWAELKKNAREVLNILGA